MKAAAWAGGGGSAALEGGELEAAARLWRAGSRRQRGSGGRGIGGGSATVESGEQAAARLRGVGRIWWPRRAFPTAENTSVRCRAAVGAPSGRRNH